MAKRIEDNLRRTKTWGQMVITQNLFRRLKLVLPQLRDFEENIVIHELAPAALLVLTCEDDHDIEIRRRLEFGILG